MVKDIGMILRSYGEEFEGGALLPEGLNLEFPQG
jgi:hypothetical protein